MFNERLAVTLAFSYSGLVSFRCNWRRKGAKVLAPLFVSFRHGRIIEEIPQQIGSFHPRGMDNSRRNILRRNRLRGIWHVSEKGDVAESGSRAST